jgi:hypothetical protein
VLWAACYPQDGASTTPKNAIVQLHPPATVRAGEDFEVPIRLAGLPNAATRVAISAAGQGALQGAYYFVGSIADLPRAVPVRSVLEGAMAGGLKITIEWLDDHTSVGASKAEVHAVRVEGLLVLSPSSHTDAVIRAQQLFPGRAALLPDPSRAGALETNGH